MAEDLGVQAAGLLVDRAWDAISAGRYQEALSAAGRAAEAAGQIDDLVLLVRALDVEANTLNLIGDATAALARYTRILGLAQDPASRHRLDDPDAARVVARAHWDWVGAARYLTSIPLRDLFGVLDAAERWVAATGHRDWRASILAERADLHALLGEYEAAVAAAQEALADKIRHPDAPGYGLTDHRYTLGDILCDAGRAAEAVPYYQAILAEPDAGPWERFRAHEGLSWCAVDAGDLVAARREARLAVQLAEALGDDALCSSLGVLARACRAAGDLEAAWQAAVRRLEPAGRIGDHYRPYQAAIDAADIALDRGDHAAAGRLLDELDQHARAMDTATGTTTHTAQAARLRQRLT